MMPRLRHHNRLPGLAACISLACAVLTGCIDRRFIITTEPQTAVVLVNGKPAGQSPADRQWLYNGTYRITLIKDGYETTVIDQPVPPKWYEYFPLDFISENVNPFIIRDVRTFSFTMKPLQVVAPEAVRDRAEQLRIQGQSIGTSPLPPGSLPAGGLPAAAPAGAPRELPAPRPLPQQQPPQSGPAPQVQPGMLPAPGPATAPQWSPAKLPQT